MSWLGKRPETPQSGVLLQTEYSIQHRSDLLMLEHVLNVRNTQESLKKALFELENARSSEEIEEKRKLAEEIHQKCEHLIVLLQVMNKLNKEVAYARADLDDALYNGQGNINAARKRVIWLEDKMGALCGKQKLKSGANMPFSLVHTEFAGSDTEREDSERAQLSDFDSEHSTTQLGVAGLPTFGVDILPQRMRYSQSASRDAVSLSAALKRVKVLREMEKKSQVSEREPTPEPLYKHKPIIFAESEEESESESESESGSGSESEFGEEKKEEEERVDDEEDETTENQKEGPAQTSEGKAAIPEPAGVQPATPGSVVKPGVARDEPEPVEQAQTFLTEVSTPKSKVTITEDKKSVSGTVQEAATPDQAEQYWASEHHRFELSDFAEVMRDVDPLSYHNVGLAVPGTFIEKEDSQFDELPWRPHRKGSDIKDIHRIALDKLATRIYGMQDKLYSAAMLSVKPSKSNTDMPREASFLQNLDTRLSSKGSDGKMIPERPLAEVSRPLTVETVELPQLEDRRLGTSASGRLVYYPKPIPPPDVLPITRTNKNKVYPRLSSTYSDTSQCQLEPAQRMVDQRNLHEETRLVLYRERPKHKPRGPSVHERRFRRMLERDKTASSRSSAPFIVHVDGEFFRKKLKKTFSMAAAMAKLQGERRDSEDSGISTWGKIKPQSRGKQYSGLRWERVKTIVHNNLVSVRVGERRDAAKQLGMLRCGDTMVFFALKERLDKDDDERVRYESAKSLILIGCWEDEVLQVILRYLVIGNTEIRQDLIKTMISGKNVQYVNKNVPTFPEMVKVLSHFCRNPDPEDPISFEAAVLLGRLCVSDHHAKEKLKKAVIESSDSHIKSKAVEILVKQLNCTDSVVVTSIQDILSTSVVWKHRELAAKLLISLGPGHPCVVKDSEQIYQLLERRLWDDPSKEVRTSAAKALTALGMFARACEKIEKRLEDSEEEARAQAAISVGTLGMKSEKLTRLMLEMLELDASDYVRLMIIRSFAALRLTDRRVMRTLREREKLEGPLARESKKALQVLEGVLSSGTRSITPKTLTPTTPHRKTTK